MLALLDEGAAGMNSTQIAEAQERLGANINTSASMDRTNVGLTSLSANLAPSLKLFSDIVLKPDFVPGEVERLRGQQLARIQSELTNPQAIAFRTLPPILFGAKHPYGISFTGTGDVATVGKVTRDEIVELPPQMVPPGKSDLLCCQRQAAGRDQGRAGKQLWRLESDRPCWRQGYVGDARCGQIRASS